MTQEQARKILSEYLDLDKEEHNEFLDAIRTLIQTIDEIEQIINAPVYIQEDVMRYKMICEVMKNDKRTSQDRDNADIWVAVRGKETGT